MKISHYSPRETTPVNVLCAMSLSPLLDKPGLRDLCCVVGCEGSAIPHTVPEYTGNILLQQWHKAYSKLFIEVFLSVDICVAHGKYIDHLFKVSHHTLFMWVCLLDGADVVRFDFQLTEDGAWALGVSIWESCIPCTRSCCTPKAGIPKMPQTSSKWVDDGNGATQAC